MLIELRFVASIKASEIELLEEVVSKIVAQARATLEKDYSSAFVAGGNMRPLAQEELFLLVPRRVHLRKGKKQICTTPFVSLKNLTDNPDEVTCKRCRHEIDAGNG